MFYPFKYHILHTAHHGASAFTSDVLSCPRTTYTWDSSHTKNGSQWRPFGLSRTHTTYNLSDTLYAYNFYILRILTFFGILSPAEASTRIKWHTREDRRRWRTFECSWRNTLCSRYQGYSRSLTHLMQLSILYTTIPTSPIKSPHASRNRQYSYT